VIIQYEAPQVRIVRQLQRLGVTPENPVLYVQRYGATLRDSVTLVQEARAAGVVEDISPPVLPGSFAATEGQFSSTGGAIGAGGLTGAGFGGVAGELAYEASAGGASASAAYLESPAAGVSGVGSFGQGATGYATGTLGGGAAGVGTAGLGYTGLGVTGLGTTLGTAGLGLGGGATTTSSSYESYSTGGTLGAGALGISGGYGVSSADAAFAAADLNQDNVISRSEFATAGY